ncbi:ribbon-helix-helix protein, CopG family [Pelagerythrobacter sp.]|uniref:ribbon-helix-helix protein, CopG family n=1 Tax=Pelagerythrobacter sp. TaxID=2800702 RepID=UPI0035B0C890
MRILTDIPDDDVEKLDAFALRRKSSRAALIRDAVKIYLLHNADTKSWIARGAGFWKDRDDIGDAIDYQRALREDRTAYENL